MPFGDYKDMADCISKNTGKVDDPGAYCASIHHQITGKWPSEKESHRHPDFQKIYQQFVELTENGETRYYDWLAALGLDETHYYGYGRQEQFQWVKRHVDFHLWKEDMQAKYWSVEAAFPVESMNRNVYTEQEHIEAARTLAHKPVNLNHKFSLPTIDIPAAKFEDGVVECVLRVPKNLYCPICKENKTINDLIMEKGIVNVSLEAVCTLESDVPGKCEGLEFTGLSLLMKNVLPGIPLTRIMPLESIMVEALGAETKNKKGGRKVQKIVMKVLEQTEPVLPDEQGQCPEGMILNPELGQCVKDTSCPEGQHWDEDNQKCVSDIPIKPEDAARTAKGSNPAEDVGVGVLSPEVPKASDEISGGATRPKEVPKPTDKQPGAPETLPKPETQHKIEPASPHDCGDGYHWDADAGHCLPDSPVSERVRRFKAEDKASSYQTQVAMWEKRFIDLDGKYQYVLGQVTSEKQRADKLEKAKDEAYLLLKQEELKSKTLRRARDDTLGNYEDVKAQLEKYQREYEGLNRKYADQLSMNLELSKSNTKANEDYLTVAAKCERLEAQLNKAKSISRKVLKIKV